MKLHVQVWSVFSLSLASLFYGWQWQVQTTLGIAWNPSTGFGYLSCKCRVCLDAHKDKLWIFSIIIRFLVNLLHFDCVFDIKNFFQDALCRRMSVTYGLGTLGAVAIISVHRHVPEKTIPSFFVMIDARIGGTAWWFTWNNSDHYNSPRILFNTIHIHPDVAEAL